MTALTGGGAGAAATSDSKVVAGAVAEDTGASVLFKVQMDKLARRSIGDVGDHPCQGANGFADDAAG